MLFGATKVSLVVGTLLNLINQGEVLWGEQLMSWWQLFMNYAVPFGVSSYSAACHEWRSLLRGGQ
ncbi:hypothetical protein D3C75_1360040 [compost metagenome]